VNDPLGLVCLALQVLARLLCVDDGFANEETNTMDGQRFGELHSAVLAKIFRRKEEEATGDWRKFHNELHGLYSSPNGWVEIGALGGGEVCIQKCAGKPEGMRTFGRPMPRWEGNIQMDLKGTG